VYPGRDNLRGDPRFGSQRGRHAGKDTRGGQQRHCVRVRGRGRCVTVRCLNGTASSVGVNRAIHPAVAALRGHLGERPRSLPPGAVALACGGRDVERDPALPGIAPLQQAELLQSGEVRAQSARRDAPQRGERRQRERACVHTWRRKTARPVKGLMQSREQVGTVR